MSEPLETYINGCANWADDVTYTLNFVINNCNALATALETDGNPNAAAKCTDLADSIGSVRTSWGLTGYNFRNYLIWSLLEINNLIDATGGVDMNSILNAMLKADFTQLQKFIGIIDAYRVALWNAPFNAEFYAALARGFVKWPQY